MLNLTLDTPIPSTKQAIDVMYKHNNRFGIPIDFDRLLEYYAYFRMSGYDKLRRVSDYVAKYNNVNVAVDDFKDAHFVNFLKKAGVSDGLLTTDAGKISVGSESLESAINTGLYSKELVTLMKLYADYKADYKAVSLFKKIISNEPIVGLETWDNHRMILVHPIWAAQLTGRLGAKEPGIMNMNKELGDIFTVPKGWIYYEVDSGQIEPRITQSWILKDEVLKKCTMMYNDAYYGYLHYCTKLSNEQRAGIDQNIIPMDVKGNKELEDRRDKLKKFGNAAMYGSKENLLNDPDKDAFIKYIGGHKERIKLQNRVEDLLDRGQRIFYTAFGTPIDITAGESDNKYRGKGEDSYYKHLVRNAINNPIQGTAADLMRYSVIKADGLLRRKAPNSLILQYVHDSGKFMIAESDYDNVIDELKEITSYQVEDWIPVYGKPVEGIHSSEIKRFLA